MSLEIVNQHHLMHDIRRIDPWDHIRKINAEIGWTRYEEKIGQYFWDPDTIVLLALKENMPVGYVFLTFSNKEQGYIPFIATALKGEKIGTALLSSACQYALDLGHTAVQLESEGNTLGFYQKAANKLKMNLGIKRDGFYENGSQSFKVSLSRPPEKRA